MTRRAFTLIEVAVATAIAGVLLVASLTVVGASATGQAKVANLQRGHFLARAMLAEATGQAFEDPNSPVSGPETGEAGANRLGFDDVDDYAGLAESPPVERDGSPIPGAEGWTRSVAVNFVAPGDLDQAVGTDTGIKLIVVTVARGEAIMASLTGLRTRGHDRICE